MFKGKKVSITIPVFNEGRFIQKVLSNIPDIVDYIVVVDDASTDNSWKQINQVNDSRIFKIKNNKNQGVGKSTLDGHQKGVELDADFLVRIDGDHQMDMDYLIPLLEPLLENNVHFTKGNRLRKKEMRKDMPKFRFFGNVILSKMTQYMTGYRNISDPQNGYTAIKKEVFKLLKKERIKLNYIYENSVLFELSELNANIREIDMYSKYGEETSSIKYTKFITSMFSYMIVCIIRKFRKSLSKLFGRAKKKTEFAIKSGFS